MSTDGSDLFVEPESERTVPAAPQARGGGRRIGRARGGQDLPRGVHCGL